MAQETLDIYAPLANRLGISWIKTELEDLSFRWLKPAEYADLAEKVGRRKREREQYISDVVRLIEGKLTERELKGRVSGRFKHLYSIWKKMRTNSIEFDQVHDMIAFRLIMPTVPSCYEALGLIHQLWKPVPGRFKDFVAIPKPNMYQSLHTTVIGPGGDRVEVQIRTEEMHRIAEEGIAAHWAYKEGKALVRGDDEKFAWLRQLMEWQQDLKDPKEFLETVKVDLFTDEVFVFTPKGDVKSLPRGATPVDFAYAIHSDVGGRCVGAKVNGKIVPLRYKLKNGDTVEVLTNPAAHPSKDWLTFVKTSRAQQRIRGFIKQQQREKSQQLGRELLDKEFRRFGLNLNKMLKSGELKPVAAELGYRVEDDILVAVGYGKVAPGQLVQRLPADKLARTSRRGPGGVAPTASAEQGAVTDLERVTELAAAGRPPEPYRYSSAASTTCWCSSAGAAIRPRRSIVGFITRNQGVTVHTVGCPRARPPAAPGGRHLGVRGDVSASDATSPTADRPGRWPTCRTSSARRA